MRLPFTPSQFSASACALLQLQGRQLLARLHSSHQPPLWHSIHIYQAILGSHTAHLHRNIYFFFVLATLPLQRWEVYLARRNQRIAAPRIRTSSPPFPTTPNCK